MALKPGIYAAQLVPFTAEGRVKERELSAMVRRNVEVSKIDGLYIGGSTGENFLIDTAAKRTIMETAARAAKGRVAMIAQVGCLDLREAQDLGRLAASLGYDAVSAVTPYYYRFGFAEIRDYYVRIAEAAGLPMLVYSIPAFTGTSFDLEQSRKLYEHPLIAGFKYTSNDLFTMERLISTFPSKVVFSGYDELLLCGRALGAYGAIGSTYNVTAHVARRIWEAVGSGRMDEGREAQAHLNAFISEILPLGVFQSLKAIVGMEGIDTGDCLPPFAPLSPEAREKARAAFARIAELR